MSVDPRFISEIERKYSEYLRGIIRDTPFSPIVIKNKINEPVTLQEVNFAIPLFTNHLKGDNRLGWEIKWKKLGGREQKTLNTQIWPVKMTIPTEEDLFYFIDRRSEVALFRERLKMLLDWNAAIREWLLMKPGKVLQLNDVWDDLCGVVDFLLNNDVASQYIRAVPVPACTKFIKDFESDILAILCFLEPEKFNSEQGCLADLLKLAEKPFFYPARWLDVDLAGRYSSGMIIQSFVPAELKKVNWDVKNICLIENETPLYTFPETKDMLAIFSWGKALTLLEDIPLLRNARLFYWGDLDEDGFMMLDSLRARFTHVESIFMDEAAIQMHEVHKHVQKHPYRRPDMKYLSSREKQAYELLAIGNYRIEQERLTANYVQQVLNNLLS